MVANEHLLLMGRYHHGGEARVRMAECGEDFFPDAEVGMPHVRGFFDARQCKG
jgi:hypothetical protein